MVTKSISSSTARSNGTSTSAKLSTLPSTRRHISRRLAELLSVDGLDVVAVPTDGELRAMWEATSGEVQAA